MNCVVNSSAVLVLNQNSKVTKKMFKQTDYGYKTCFS